MRSSAGADGIDGQWDSMKSWVQRLHRGILGNIAELGIKGATIQAIA